MAGPTITAPCDRVLTSAFAAAGPALVIGIDALTYGALALQVLLLAPRLPARPPAPPDGSEATGFRLLRRQPQLVGLLAVTWAFYLLYGPVEVALPLYVADDLAASAGVLGTYWALFAVGAVVGGVAGGTLPRIRLWPAVTAIIAGWGAALLPFGLDAPVWVTMTGFALGGLIYGPFPALSFTLFQNAASPASLPSLLAARAALLLLATPLGAALGGPLSARLGGAGALLASGAATLALAAGTVAALLVLRRRRSP
jgi:hypothetical protein